MFNYFLPSLSETPNILSKLLISDVVTQIQHSPAVQQQVEQSASFVTLGSPAYNNASKFAEECLHSKARFNLGQAPPSQTEVPPTLYSPLGAFHSNPSPSPMTGAPQFQDPAHLSVAGSADAAPGYLPSAIISSASESHTTLLVGQGTKATNIDVEGVPNLDLSDGTYGFVERIVDHASNRSVFYVAGISELSTVGAAYYLMSEWANLHREYGDARSFLIVLQFNPNDYNRWNIAFKK